MVWLSPEQAADRCRRAAAAALAAGRALGLQAESATVLHDVFSVVVRLDPTPVVARVPVVLPQGYTPERQHARQQRELDVVAWLDAHGVPVVPPSPLVPRTPVRRDGFPMTFWELADVAADHEPYSGVAIAQSAELHAGLSRYRAPLPFLAPFNEAGPGMFAALEESDLLGAADIDRARAEYGALRLELGDPATFAARYPGVTVQAVQGDAPSHNVIRTTSGIRFSDFEDVSLGPVEWDLAMMGPDAVAEYDDAAVRRGLRPTDPRVQRLMDTARTLQFIGCATLVPQLPVLADGLAPVIASWRASTPLT